MRLGDLCGSETERLTPTDDLIIDYIDISSVSNETKSIIGKQTLQSTEAPSRAQRVLKPNDILVSTVRPNLNAVAVYDGTFENLAVASTGFCVLRCKPGVDHRFVFNVCKSKAFIKAMTEQATGASYPAVNDKIIRAFEVPDLSFDCQEQLTARLDTIQRVIDQRKRQLLALDTLIKARFVEMFGDFKTNPMGWPVVSFEEIASIDGNMTTDYERYADYPHIGIDSIEKDTGLLKGYRTVAEDGVISGKYIFTPAHIIYSKIRPNLNKVALPDFEGLCSADAYPILPIAGKCNRIFLAYDMRSTFFLDYILQFCNRTNLPKVNRKEVGGFRTPLPPIQLQDQFATFVSQVDKSKSVIQTALAKDQLLFDSLMQKYFG